MRSLGTIGFDAGTLFIGVAVVVVWAVISPLSVYMKTFLAVVARHEADRFLKRRKEQNNDGKW